MSLLTACQWHRSLGGGGKAARRAHDTAVVVVPAERRRRIRGRPIFASAAAVLVVAGDIASPLFVRPLDVIWFTLLRKLELYLPTAVLLHGWGECHGTSEAGPGARPCLACRGRPRGARVAVAERDRA
jgi:hypothetical protein